MSKNTKDEMNEEQELQDSQEETELENSTEGQEAPEELDPVKVLEDLVQEKEDAYLRLFAEFDNFKKRTSRERLDLIATAGSDTMVSLLPVLDDFDRAMEQMHNTEDIKSVIEGIELIHVKLSNTLEQKGLKAMKSKDEKFNPEIHEAITEIPAPSKKMKGKIVDEVEKGYMMGDKIIRFPKVVVGK